MIKHVIDVEYLSWTVLICRFSMFVSDVISRFKSDTGCTIEMSSESFDSISSKHCHWHWHKRSAFIHQTQQRSLLPRQCISAPTFLYEICFSFYQLLYFRGMILKHPIYKCAIYIIKKKQQMYIVDNIYISATIFLMIYQSSYVLLLLLLFSNCFIYFISSKRNYHSDYDVWFC